MDVDIRDSVQDPYLHRFAMVSPVDSSYLLRFHLATIAKWNLHVQRHVIFEYKILQILGSFGTALTNEKNDHVNLLWESRSSVPCLWDPENNLFCIFWNPFLWALLLISSHAFPTRENAELKNSSQLLHATHLPSFLPSQQAVILLISVVICCLNKSWGCRIILLYQPQRNRHANSPATAACSWHVACFDPSVWGCLCGLTGLWIWLLGCNSAPGYWLSSYFIWPLEPGKRKATVGILHFWFFFPCAGTSHVNVGLLRMYDQLSAQHENKLHVFCTHSTQTSMGAWMFTNVLFNHLQRLECVPKWLELCVQIHTVPAFVINYSTYGTGLVINYIQYKTCKRKEPLEPPSAQWGSNFHRHICAYLASVCKY